MQSGQHANRVKRLEKGSGRWSREQIGGTNQDQQNNHDTTIRHIQQHHLCHDKERKRDSYAKEQELQS